jgi:hypothetical protein
LDSQSLYFIDARTAVAAAAAQMVPVTYGELHKDLVVLAASLAVVAMSEAAGLRSAPDH